LEPLEERALLSTFGVLSTTPSLSGGTLPAGSNSLVVNFSASTLLGADNPANYQLQNAGADGLLGTADDTASPLTLSYSSGAATLSYSALTENVYRLTVRDAITDVGGSQLDGNGDGIPGGNWTADFVVIPNGRVFPDAATSYPTGGNNTSYYAATGDFSGDGKLDLAVTNNSTTGSVSVFRGDGNGGFAAAVKYNTGGSGTWCIATADFNRDGRLDIVVGHASSDTIGVLLANGSGGFYNAVTYSSGGDFPKGVVAGDFNADGKPDIAVANYSSNSIGVLLGNGSGGFTTGLTYNAGGTHPSGVTAGDFNSDGKTDLAVAINSYPGKVGILLNNGTGLGAATTYSPGGNYPSCVITGDYNGDGKLDLATAQSNGMGVLLGNGSGGFGSATVYSAGGHTPMGITQADFSGDGILDMAVTVGDAEVGHLLGNGNGGFGTFTIYSTGMSDTSGIIHGDFNRDGKPDVAVTTISQPGSVGVMLSSYIPVPVLLNSPHSYSFDINVSSFGTGEINQGYNKAFDGDGRLFVGGTAFAPSQPSYSLADDGRTVLTATGTAAGLTVNRKITVPNTGTEDFARTVDVFTNLTGSPITTTIRIVGNLGSDGKTTVFATSDGTGVPSPNDLWIGTDDDNGFGSTAAVIHYIRGPGAMKPDSVTVTDDNLEWSYTITVPAGETVELAYFTIVNASRSSAIAAANALVTPTGFGGQAAAFLTPAEQALIANFLNLNQAPVLTPAAPAIGSTDEDTAFTIDLVGTFINNGVGSTGILDADIPTLLNSIALTAVTGRGVWSYSLDGVNFSPVGTVSAAAALLLPSTAKLRYMPDIKNDETATITYRAWDQSYGTPGTKADASVGGGVTTFSTATDTASLNVPSVNDAPVLTSAAPLLGRVKMDTVFTASLTGSFLNHGAGTTAITDVDAGATVGGIAIVAITGYQDWLFSLDGATFEPIGPVSVSSVRLLPKWALIRYVPDGIRTETATLSYCAWDTTVGVPGEWADTTTAGGTTAFSTATDTASLVVNDAPVLIPAAPVMATTNENMTIAVHTAWTFINSGDGTTTISDPNAGAIVGGIAITSATGLGSWSYSTEGEIYTPLGTVSNASALLLPESVFLRYVPDLKNGEMPTITYRAWDQTSGTEGSKVDLSNVNAVGGATAFSADADTATLVVTAVNDAPMLTAAAPSLGYQNSTTGIVVNLGSFLNNGAGSTTITDVDNGSLIGGIAITGRSAGFWFYSLDGVNFIPIPAVTVQNALLLPASAQVRYTPNGVSESVTISYRAWDQTVGLPGGFANTSTNGGVSAFSSATDTATMVIDYQPPTVAAIMPLLSGGMLAAGSTSLVVHFSEAMANAGISGSMYYQLQDSGPDGLLGNADDTIYIPTVTYSGTTATLKFAPLAENVYRLTIGDSLTDRAGNKLDGNGDGIAGGNLIKEFVAMNSAVFGNVSTFSSNGMGPRRVAVGDFNKDGISDLAVTNFADNSLSVFMGNGSGGFAAAGIYQSIGSGPQGISTGDFNGDGYLDLAVVYTNSNVVNIFWNSRGGGFGQPTPYSTGSNPMGVITADFNSDGKADLAISNSSSNTVTTLINNNYDYFNNYNYDSSGVSPQRGLAAGDFNGDGRTDLAVTNSTSGTIGILLRNTSGGFATAVTYSTGGSNPQGIATGDFNGDGKLDLAVVNMASNTLSILFGNGSGVFGSATVVGTQGLVPMGIVAGDFNGDGKLDLAVTNHGSSTLSVFARDGSGSFNVIATYSDGFASGMEGIATGDFNGDGRLDLVTTNAVNNKVGIFLNVYAPPVVTLNSSQSLPFNIATQGVYAGAIVQGSQNAFDGDGRLKINNVFFQPSQSAYTTADNGQTLITSSGTFSGLTVNRCVTVPNSGGEDFARTVDVFTNSTASAITAMVQIVGNLGSDAATALFATSSGDLVPTPDDLWFGTDAGGTGTAVIHCFRSLYGLKPTAVSVAGDNVIWTFSLTVPAGQTRELGYFTIQAADRAQAISQADALLNVGGFLDTAALGLSANDLASLANFQFDHPPTAIQLSNTTVPENQAGAMVGTLTTTDSDQGETYAYVITNDPSGKFEIVGDALKLKDGEKFDFESMADGQVTISIRTTDAPGGLSFEKPFTVTVSDVSEPLIVLPGDLPAGAANLTMKLAADGKLHVYQTVDDVETDVVPPHVPASVASVELTGRNVDDVLTVESMGTSNADLLINHLRVIVGQDNAIPSGTAVTVDGGILNYDGHAVAIGNLMVKNGGEVTVASITNSTTTVQSGTLTATSITCDTLIIGFGAGDSTRTETSTTARRIAAASPAAVHNVTLNNNRVVATAWPDCPGIAAQPVAKNIAKAAENAAAIVSVVGEISQMGSRVMPEDSTREIATAMQLPQDEEFFPQIATRQLSAACYFRNFFAANRDNSFAHAYSRMFDLAKKLEDSGGGELPGPPVATKNQPAIVSATQQSTYSSALESVTKEYFSIEPEESDLLAVAHFRKQDGLAKTAVDEFCADLMGVLAVKSNATLSRDLSTS
jgi:hypothetical protein